jgi:hypothetical protein
LTVAGNATVLSYAQRLEPRRRSAAGDSPEKKIAWPVVAKLG